METCIYRIDFEKHCSWSLGFDEMHAIAYVEAPKDVFRWDLEKLLSKKLEGFYRLNSFSPINVIKLAA